MENNKDVQKLLEEDNLCIGTIDSYIVYRLSKGKTFITDTSNVSRTMLYNINTMTYDNKLLKIFGIPQNILPKVVSNGKQLAVAETKLGDIPISSILGDQQSSLFGQGCFEQGLAKATYGTGSSVMMNIGNEPVLSKSGLALTVAWRLSGEISYAMEGNINYTGAVIRWMEKDIGIINSPLETESLAIASDKEDTSCLVPAFSGLGAPYWDSGAKAILTGMTRTTGRNEIVRAGLESIAYQIDDVIAYLENDTGVVANMLHADGGAANNGYLMQFQSDLSNIAVGVPRSDGLSGYGAALIAGIRAGLYQEGMGAAFEIKKYHPSKNKEWQEEKRMLWHDAVRRCLYRNHVG